MCSEASHFKRKNVKSTHYGIQSARHLGPEIWNVVPQNIKESNSLNEFKSLIKFWKPDTCPCRLCKNYIAQVGFIWSYIQFTDTDLVDIFKETSDLTVVQLILFKIFLLVFLKKYQICIQLLNNEIISNKQCVNKSKLADAAPVFKRDSALLPSSYSPAGDLLGVIYIFQ